MAKQAPSKRDNPAREVRGNPRVPPAGRRKKVQGDGAGNGDRTRDFKLGKLALCQLSYARSFLPRPQGHAPAASGADPPKGPHGSDNYKASAPPDKRFFGAAPEAGMAVAFCTQPCYS